MAIWWIKSDACGLFCAAFTVFLLVYAEVVMSTFILLPWLGFDYNYIIFTSFTIFALVAHTRCQFTDPGAVPDYCLPPNLPQHIDFSKIPVRPYCPPKICRTCRTLKTRRTFHCNAAGRCIVNLDHFCAWCNNSIGILNHRWFFQFLAFTAASCLYCAGLLIARFLSCNSSPHMCNISSVGMVFSIVTFIESLIFGIFTLVMLYDQISGVLEEQFRGQEYYKAQYHAYQAAMQTDASYFSDPPIKPIEKTAYELFQEIFGAPFGLSWFNPFTRPDPIVEHFHVELANCVKDADVITKRFVTFAVAVENGEIQLTEDDDGDDIAINENQKIATNNHNNNNNTTTTNQNESNQSSSPSELNLKDFDSPTEQPTTQKSPNKKSHKID